MSSPVTEPLGPTRSDSCSALAPVPQPTIHRLAPERFEHGVEHLALLDPRRSGLLVPVADLLRVRSVGLQRWPSTSGF
jgi:hypothetical protein